MSIQTDDFSAAPSRRVVSGTPASPIEEAIERAFRPKPCLVGNAELLENVDCVLQGVPVRAGAHQYTDLDRVHGRILRLLSFFSAMPPFHSLVNEPPGNP